MDKATLKKKVIDNINRETAVNFLKSLIRLPSPSGQPTLSQELVLQRMEQMNLRYDRFIGNDESLKKLADYCPLPDGEKIDEGAYNLVGIKKGKRSGSKSLMLFSHIDTEPEDKDASKNVLEGEIKDGKLYGLGAADSKGGVAAMILAAEAVLKEVELDGDLILMSVLGKKGGSAGTLSAIDRGYKADGGIYIHPAETGHGFREIKCYSMGTVDLNIRVCGEEGAAMDELDDSEVNAIVEGAKVIDALVKWDKKRRKRLLFKEGQHKGEAQTKLNISTASGGYKVGKDPLTFDIKSRLYFGPGETIDSIISELKLYFKESFENETWLSKNIPEIEPLFIRATPAYIEKDEQISKIVRKNINEVIGEQDFIYQYHGASDIRLPILYGDIPTVGIGPLGGGFYGKEWTDWVDIDDYVISIKILASIIIDWCLED